MTGSRREWLALLLVLLAGGLAQAQERYYVLLFASQPIPPDPRKSHTFALFVKATGEAPQARLEAHSISWLPQTLDIHMTSPPECGHNFGCQETIRWALEGGERISLWGPYETTPELYARGLCQVALLESGQVQYKAVDSGYRSNHVSNCIHAVSSVVEGHRLRVASPGWGETATYAVTRRYRPWLVNPCQTHDWLLAALGLDGYPLILRPMEPPRSGVIFSAVRQLTGRPEVIRQRPASP